MEGNGSKAGIGKGGRLSFLQSRLHQRSKVGFPINLWWLRRSIHTLYISWSFLIFYISRSFLISLLYGVDAWGGSPVTGFCLLIDQSDAGGGGSQIAIISLFQLLQPLCTTICNTSSSPTVIKCLINHSTISLNLLWNSWCKDEGTREQIFSSFSHQCQQN